MIEPTWPAQTAWVNCAMGVAGDMLLAALIDAGADRLAVMSAWAALDLDDYAATWERVDRGGVSALWTNLALHRHDEHHHDEHHHDADHDEPHHAHRPAVEVLELIERAALPARVKADSIRVYRTLAAVEADIHHTAVDEIELHEVGALDSILDVVGVCAALDDLDITDLTYSPIGVGTGVVRTAHGLLPHPAPATVRLIAEANAPIVGVDTTMETATPTGVALLSVLGSPTASAPPMDVSSVGYGAGTANPVGRANVVQVLVGTRQFDESSGDEVLYELSTNVDDSTGEIVAYTIARLLELGALDAWATPIVMKKGRSAITVNALVRPATLGSVRDALLSETGSLGARVRSVGRWPVSREIDSVVVDGHRIALKVVAGRVKVEFDDAAAAARATGRPLRHVMEAAALLAQPNPPEAPRQR